MTAVENGLVTIDENVRDIVSEPQKIERLVGFEQSDQCPRKPILEHVTGRPNIVEAGYTHPLVFSLAKGGFMTMC
ncbi:hypothetical protein V492_01734 [Pseudogymnoascus sp. VKM F-4246]|nr:hypothetical protein V492_01734 [Pseudogymnoascus sp. VKM F-4246]